jgi:hypothetical protein
MWVAAAFAVAALVAFSYAMYELLKADARMKRLNARLNRMNYFPKEKKK